MYRLLPVEQERGQPRSARCDFEARRAGKPTGISGAFNPKRQLNWYLDPPPQPWSRCISGVEPPFGTLSQRSGLSHEPPFYGAQRVDSPQAQPSQSHH